MNICRPLSIAGTFVQTYNGWFWVVKNNCVEISCVSEQNRFWECHQLMAAPQRDYKIPCKQLMKQRSSSAKLIYKLINSNLNRMKLNNNSNRDIDDGLSCLSLSQLMKCVRFDVGYMYVGLIPNQFKK